MQRRAQCTNDRVHRRGLCERAYSWLMFCLPACLRTAWQLSRAASGYTCRMALVSAETNCYPYETRACKDNWYPTHRPSNNIYQFANTGGWMGPAAFFIDILNAQMTPSPPRHLPRDAFPLVLHFLYMCVLPSPSRLHQAICSCEVAQRAWSCVVTVDSQCLSICVLQLKRLQSTLTHSRPFRHSGCSSRMLVAD